MAKKNEKVQKQQEQQLTPQVSTPTKPVELTDEDLAQVVGGVQPIDYKPNALPDLDAGGNA